MKKTVILFTFIVFCSTALFAEDQIGKNLFRLGDSAASLGRGATGVASFGSGLFYMNPASIAAYERLGLGLQYGSLNGQFYNPDLSLALPTSYGVFGGSLRYYNLPSSSDFSSGLGVSLGAAKDFTSRIMLGLALNVFAGSADGTIVYTGATLGSIYRLKDRTGKKGFGLYDPKAGFALNLGLPLGGNGTYANFNSITIGLNSGFYRHSRFTLGIFADVSLIDGEGDTFMEYPVKAGIEAEIMNRYIVRAGAVYPEGYDYGDFTAGLGYRFRAGDFEGTADYSLCHYRDGAYIHYLGVNLEYGKLDRTPPATSIESDNKYVSPNHDGAQDYVVFALGVKDDSRIKGWKLQVKDANNRVVKEFKTSERDTIEGLTLKKFIKRIIQKKESQVVPEKIMWDGTDAEGKTVKDGKYTYAFNAWDERNNIAAVRSGMLFIDNTSPVVSLQSTENLFSPNGDNQKDTFVITQDIKTAPEDTWKAGFRDKEGNVLKSYSFNGNEVPGRIAWDGKDDQGKDVPEGLYYYFISSKDLAGNTAEGEIREITLTRKYEVADITLSSLYFSFARDREVAITPALSNTGGLESWKVTVYDDSQKPVREISGRDALPEKVTWDGKDNEGEKLGDGEYFIRFSTRFRSGNTPESFDKKIVIDSTPPDADITHDHEYFSPDGDGENDVLTISAKAKDRFGIKRWKITIFAPAGTVFRSFEGNGDVAEEIKWDGLSEDKDIVESAADYFAQLEVEDMAGNVASSDRDRIKVDILVIVTERGLKMRISNIEFEFDKATLKRRGKKILNRVYELLGKYENYDVIVEGHTDDVGTDEYNLKLSERRAKAVEDYLIDRGVNSKRLRFVGMGETVPLYPNTNKENKRRNRRVEFLLIKKKR